jgi:methylphosphotriester-DNA--protein-cysteine methyltransferase
MSQLKEACLIIAKMSPNEQTRLRTWINMSPDEQSRAISAVILANQLHKTATASQEAAERAVWAAEAALVEALEKMTGLKGLEIEAGDEWDCPSSPTQHCVFHGDCIYCHQPKERK